MIPHDEIHLLTTLKDNSIVFIRDDMQMGWDKFLERFNDTLGRVWSTRLYSFEDRAYSMQPVFLSEGAQGVTLIYRWKATGEEGESVRGVIYDPATGNELYRTSLMETTNELPVTLVCSSDSSRILLYQARMTDSDEGSRVRSMRLHAHVFDVNLRSLGEDTLTTDLGELNPDVDANRLRDVQIDTEGNAYLLTSNGPSVFQIFQWNLSASTVKSLQWSISGDDLRKHEAVVTAVHSTSRSPGELITAVLLVASGGAGRQVFLGAAISLLDFNRMDVKYSTRLRLPDTVAQHLNTEAESVTYSLPALLVDPLQRYTMLVVEQFDMLTIHKYKQDDLQKRMRWQHEFTFNREQVVLLAFDRNGNPVWQQVIVRPTPEMPSATYTPDWWSINNHELRLVYKDVADAFIIRRMSVESGKERESTLLFMSDLVPHFSSIVPGAENSMILWLGHARNGRLLRIKYQ